MPTSSLSPTAQEERRLALLRELGVLDTPPEPEFDAIAAEAARLTGYEAALVSLMDADRCWFKATAGLLTAAGVPREIPRCETYCQHALGSSGIFVVNDGLLDPRFARLHGVNCPGGFRAYAGLQLFSPAGLSFGSLCVMNRAPRTPTAEDHATLRRLADCALQLLLTRRPRPPAPTAPDRDTLLVADDDEGIRQFLVILFERRGVRTLIARDGAEALRLYRDNATRIAAVLTDFNMPGLDGLALVRLLAREPHPPACAAMSGRLEDSVRRAFFDEGVGIILEKPFRLAELDAIVALVRPATPAQPEAMQ